MSADLFSNLELDTGGHITTEPGNAHLGAQRSDGTRDVVTTIRMEVHRRGTTVMVELDQSESYRLMRAVMAFWGVETVRCPKTAGREEMFVDGVAVER